MFKNAHIFGCVRLSFTFLYKKYNLFAYIKNYLYLCRRYVILLNY